jgi:F-type H+-transporting ATPase subunit gamma
MAKARALDKRRKAVRNIRKITRTMELVATARFRRAMERAVAAGAYTDRITRLVRHLSRTGLELKHPLLEPRPETRHATLLILTANRGLCGGYNAGIMRQGLRAWRRMEHDDIPERRLEVSGKRGVAGLKFRGISPDEAFNHFEDRPSFAEVDVLASRYLDEFRAGKLDRLQVAYTRFDSLSRQEATVQTLLPLSELDVPGIEEEEDEELDTPTPYDFMPSPESILDEVIPTSFKIRLLKCFLDAAVSEQVARMLAMKAATENADSMISQLTMIYNRARQGQITSELLEVVSGAEALSH